MSERAVTLVRNWTARLQENPLVGQVFRVVEGRQSDVQRCALDGLERENTAFQGASSEQFQREAVGHCHDILIAMLAIVAGDAGNGSSDPFDFVRHHAIRRARQQFPLAGSLNAYRLAHKGYWTVIRESVLNCDARDADVNACSMMLSEFLLDFFDVVSGVLTDAYLAEEKSLLALHARTRVALVEDLMRGRHPGNIETRELCERCGIRDGAHLAVAIAQPPLSTLAEAKPESAPIQLTKLVEQALSENGLGSVVDYREGQVLAIAAHQSEASRAMARALRAAVGKHRSQLGFPAAIGVSLDATQISAIPQAYEEAMRAAEFAEIKRSVVHLGEIDLNELLLRRHDATALRLIPSWTSTLRRADDDKSGNLSRTIRAFAESDLNVKRTARRLKLHTNTIYTRLNRIKKLTGVDPRSFAGTALLLTALRLLETKTAEAANGDPVTGVSAPAGRLAD
jgi:sugar diacid utilization regulator